MSDVVGWIGLGKLGLTCALTLEQNAGVEIVGYDPDPRVEKILNGTEPPVSWEQGLADMVEATTLTLGNDIDFVVDATDGIVFCSVQTPHKPEYGGEWLMPDTRADFDYSYLVEAARSVSEAADRLEKDITLVVISTVLPGTMRRLVMPVLGERVSLVYNPFFIAMGTTMHDFLNPEFILIGRDDPDDSYDLARLYEQLHGTWLGHPQGPRIRMMSIESAELTKVAYNTFISMKIVFANTLMEICDQLPHADVDEVTDALAEATDRIISPKYLTAGMGDGGACHPRDNIAMSFLARRLGLSTDPFEYVTRAREDQSKYLARLINHQFEMNPERPIVLLGKSYKPESDLTYGSPALLLAHRLDRWGIPFEHWDSHVDDDGALPLEGTIGLADKAIWVICTKHPEYADLEFPQGSTVIDPFRFVPHREGVEVISVGAGAQ